MVLAAGLLIGALCLTVIELLTIRKRTEINAGIAFALGKNLKTPSREITVDSFTIGAGSSATNLYDIYAATENHQEVLSVLEHRFNVEMSNASPLDWFDKIKELEASGSRAVGSYISNYAGQAGENASVEMFEQTEKYAEQFKSRNYPNDDVRVFDEEGSFTDHSVKSMGKVSDFKKEVRNHPDSDNYIVNSELYEKLSENGDLSEYTEKGIEIVDGGFSHEAAIKAASTALDDISEAGDISDNIPYVAAALFGVKTVNNIIAFSKRKQSGYETSVNVSGDLIRIGTTGLMATGGAKIGGTIGTIIAPGLGTLIGGGIGCLVGAIAGSSLINIAKERYKWGKIIDAIDAVGQRVKDGIFSLKKGAINGLFCLHEYKKELEVESELQRNEYKALFPYYSGKISLPNVLVYIHKKVLKKRISGLRSAAGYFENEIRKLCYESAQKMAGDKKNKIQKIERRLLGELALANFKQLMINERVDKETRKLVEDYKKQIRKAPNHPYRFSMDSLAVVQGIGLRSLQKANTKIKVALPRVNIVFIITIIIMILTSVRLISSN